MISRSLFDVPSTVRELSVRFSAITISLFVPASRGHQNLPESRPRRHPYLFRKSIAAFLVDRKESYDSFRIKHVYTTGSAHQALFIESFGL